MPIARLKNEPVRITNVVLDFKGTKIDVAGHVAHDIYRKIWDALQEDNWSIANLVLKIPSRAGDMELEVEMDESFAKGTYRELGSIFGHSNVFVVPPTGEQN